MTDYYDRLDVSENASIDEIETAFREQTREHHPDLGGDKNTYQSIVDAKKVLTDTKKQDAYDSLGHDTFISKYGARGNKRPIDPADRNTTSKTDTTTTTANTTTSTHTNTTTTSTTSSSSSSTDSSTHSTSAGSTSTANSTTSSQSTTANTASTTSETVSDPHGYTSSRTPASQWWRQTYIRWPWEILTFTSGTVTGLLLGPLFLLAGLLLLIIEWVATIVIRIFTFIAEIAGLLNSNPLPNGILPEPYFTMALTILLLLVVIALAVTATTFLSNIGDEDDEKILHYSISTSTLILLPSTLLLILTSVLLLDINAVLTHAPFTIPDFHEYTIIAAFTAAAITLSNRSRAVLGEPPISNQTNLNPVFSVNVDSLLAYGTQIAQTAVISLITLFWFAESLEWIFRVLNPDSSDAPDEPVLTELPFIPGRDWIFTAIIIAASLTVTVTALYLAGKTLQRILS